MKGRCGVAVNSEGKMKDIIKLSYLHNEVTSHFSALSDLVGDPTHTPVNSLEEEVRKLRGGG